MARRDSTPAENRQNKRKRSQSSSLEEEGEREERDQKKLYSNGVWKNLDLILSIQSKDIPPHRKTELAFDFVSLEANLRDRDSEPVRLSRLASYLSEWIQSLLISLKHGEKSSDISDPCLDFRCWVVLKFCFEKSASFSVSPNLLRPVTRVLNHALLVLDGSSSPHGAESNRLYEIVSDCLSLLFSSHGRTFNNAGAELWVSSAVAIVGLVCRILSEEGPAIHDSEVLLCLSSILLKQFASFLRFHPSPKNAFHPFVDRLLEPLLQLLVVLYARTKDGDCQDASGLLTTIEDVLSNGLFHSVHISGFSNSRMSNSNQEGKDSKGINESYHKHFFRKLKGIVAEKKSTAISGSGYLFRLFVSRVKKKKGASVSSRDIQALEKVSEASEEVHDISKPFFFEVFMRFMEPLILACKHYMEIRSPKAVECWEPDLVEAQCTLKSINEILASFMHEKIYVRAEDTSEGAQYGFLKEVYSTIISISGRVCLLWLSALNIDDSSLNKMLPLIAKEIVVAVRYFLEIEYRVAGADLVRVWLILLSYLAIYKSAEDMEHHSLLAFEIFHIGCQVIDIYSEVRQVNIPIFALSKAVRFFQFSGDGGELEYSMFVSSRRLSSKMCLKAVETLLCSQEFKLATSNAIKSIPEGQASGCIQQLKEDVIESLEWIRTSFSKADGKDSGETDIPCNTMLVLCSQAEVLGYLSETYTVVLDSLTVTTGNSVLVGNSIKDLMETITPSFSILLQNQSNNIDELFSSVMGRNIFSDLGISEFDSSFPTEQMDISWIFVFFFRMYISCRSLYQQSISLMPPNSSRKASAAMGTLLTVSCGKDWIGRSDWKDGGYFSWIAKASLSLLALIQHLSENFFPSSITKYAPLVYALHAMALQRLNDLNRQIKAFEFLQERDELLARRQSVDDDLHLPRERRKWKRLIKLSKQEAAGLTSFMTGFLHLVDFKGQSISDQSDETGEVKESTFTNKDAWDLGVCSVNEKSLPIALWWLFCQNTDIWCAHAPSKSLKKFLSLLLHHSLSFVRNSFRDVGKQSTQGPLCQTKVTVHQISSELLSDTVFHEQEVLTRHLTSRFLRILKKLLLPWLSHACASNIDLSSLSDWSEVLSILEKGSLVGMEVQHASHDDSSLRGSDSVPSDCCHLDHGERRSHFYITMELRTCQSLLNLLCWMPKGHMNATSISLYATYIINLERLVVSSLLSSQSESFFCDRYEFLRLFVSCRRTLKYLVVTTVEENLGVRESPLTSILCESSFSITWLLKSASEVVGLPQAFYGEKYSSQVNELFFLLMDQTSYVFLMLSERLMVAAMPSLMSSEKLHTEIPMCDGPGDQNNLDEPDLHSYSSEHFDAWEKLELLAETLKGQMENLMVIFKSCAHDIKSEACVNVLNWNKSSALISCFQGFLWGLVSSLSSINEKCLMRNTSKLMVCVSKLFNHIYLFEDFVNLCLNVLLIDGKWPELLRTACSHKFDHHNDLLNLEVLFDAAHRFSNDETKISSGSQPKTGKGGGKGPMSDSDDHSENSLGTDCAEHFSMNKPRLPSVHANSAVNVLGLLHQIGLQHLKGSLLQSLLKGESLEVAFLIRQLFISSAAILKLNYMLSFPRPLRSQIDRSHLASSSTGILVGTSHYVLLEMAEMIGMPHPFSFVWLDGILKYLEVLGTYFSLTGPDQSRDVYAKLIDMHLRAIGKCISLQGKAATLASHETGSNTKTLQSQVVLCDNDVLSLDFEEHSLNEFKARLRMSFKNFIRRPLELHLLSAVQALERALVGVQRGCNVIYEISTGNLNGGKVSSIVAAGVDCFDLVLECVSGHKLLGVIRRQIRSLVGALFNIILHLQNPVIFYQLKLPHNRSKNDPDSGSVILMCVEVLTKVAARHALFPMDPCHVGQCLHIPMALFQDFHQLSASQIVYSSCMFLDNHEMRPSTEMLHCILDRQYSVDLYAACCRLLCTTLRHRKSEAGRCSALLVDSVSTLLVCLETVDADSACQKGYFAWEIQEAIKCASFLCRVYEEIRQQKDIVGWYSAHFLSNYICICSGYGPLKTGIKREIDEALRPGVYALVDICSPADFQQLHTVLGEGPCRRTLATLQNDYRLNFQYGGKI